MKEFLFIAWSVQSHPEYSLWVAKFGRNGEGKKPTDTESLNLGKSLIVNIFPKPFSCLFICEQYLLLVCRSNLLSAPK